MWCEGAGMCRSCALSWRAAQASCFPLLGSTSASRACSLIYPRLLQTCATSPQELWTMSLMVSCPSSGTRFLPIHHQYIVLPDFLILQRRLDQGVSHCGFQVHALSVQGMLHSLLSVCSPAHTISNYPQLQQSAKACALACGCITSQPLSLC